MSNVKFELDGSLAIVTFNNPPLNLLGKELVAGVTQAFEEAEKFNPRGLLLQAEGDNFSAGADINMFSKLLPSQAREMLSSFLGLLHQLESLPYPTMAAVQGICVAGGLEIALSMDMIWAGDTAMLGQAEASIGAIPFAGGAQRLAARCGVAKAKEIVFTGKFYPAAKFEELNIVNRVVPTQELKDKARKFMKGISENGPTLAYKAVKEILAEYQVQGIADADRLTLDKSVGIFETEDLKTGIASMLAQGPGKAIFVGK
ncbi:MAG: enoyl-CoA hydratase/isomerase family protein [Desulfobacterales bacterium]|nr:enoyl-CoA hydratase/isomerase family protein [Desulfobacterales bacterium]